MGLVVRYRDFGGGLEGVAPSKPPSPTTFNVVNHQRMQFMMNVEQIVHDVVLRVARQQNPAIETVINDQRLTADLGFSSLDLAQLVAMLEARLDADPFASHVPFTRMLTVGDLVQAYQSYLAIAASGDSGGAADGTPSVNV